MGVNFGPVDVTEILSGQKLSAFISRGLMPACREETVRRQGAFRRSSSGLSCTAAWRIVATAYKDRPENRRAGGMRTWKTCLAVERDMEK